MTPETLVHENRIVIRTDWSGYQKVRDAIGDGHVRATYSSGAIELLSPSLEHELIKKVWAALFEQYLDHAQIPYLPGGETTFDRVDLDQGFEPDECYWLENGQQMMGVKRFDPTLHPPPDLMLEVVVTRGVVKRLPLMWSMGVREVWTFEDGRISVRARGPDGWVEAERSILVPGLDPLVMEGFLAMRHGHVPSVIKRAFREHLEATPPDAGEREQP